MPLQLILLDVVAAVITIGSRASVKLSQFRRIRVACFARLTDGVDRSYVCERVLQPCHCWRKCARLTTVLFKVAS